MRAAPGIRAQGRAHHRLPPAKLKRRRNLVLQLRIADGFARIPPTIVGISILWVEMDAFSVIFYCSLHIADGFPRIPAAWGP